MTTVLNPAPADPSLISNGILPLVDVLTPNQEEAHVLTGLPADTPERAARAARALRERGAQSVIVTLGAEGCLLESEHQTELIPSTAVEVVDTVGAGDAFNGALAVALGEKRPLIEAAAWACAAGALAVTRPGAQGALPTREEIDRLLHRLKRNRDS
jgi:ribokinase